MALTTSPRLRRCPAFGSLSVTLRPSPILKPTDKRVFPDQQLVPRPGPIGLHLVLGVVMKGSCRGLPMLFMIGEFSNTLALALPLKQQSSIHKIDLALLCLNKLASSCIDTVVFGFPGTSEKFRTLERYRLCKYTVVSTRKNRSDTVGEPISTRQGCGCYFGFPMFLGLNDGLCEAQCSALWSWPTVSHHCRHTLPQRRSRDYGTT
jgi:hypothetical protein